MRWEDRAAILAQLREIYDGSFDPKYGRGAKELKWKGRIGFIAGATLAIDTHYAVFQVLGERFLQYRLNPVSEADLGAKAISNLGQEGTTRVKIKEGFVTFFNQLEKPSVNEMELPQEIKDCLVNLACLCVRARSGVVRDNYKKSIEYIPDSEAPARLAKQLATLSYALAVLEGRKKVNVSDYLLTFKVGLDCIPRQRASVLEFLASEDRQFNTTEVAQGIDYSLAGAIRHLEDLVAHKLVEADRKGKGHANKWQLSKRTKEYFSKMITKEGKELLKNGGFKKDRCYGNILNLILETPPAQAREIINTSIPRVSGMTPLKTPNHSQKQEKQIKEKTSDQLTTKELEGHFQ